MSGTLSFAEAARKILEAEGSALTPQEIWNRAESQKLVATDGKTPEATLSAILQRASRGLWITKMASDRPFYRAGPGRFGLVAWLSPSEVQELDAEEANARAPVLTNPRTTARTARRADPAAVRELVESLFPSPSERSDVLQLLGRAIQHAHKHGAARWGVTLRRKSVHFNVGRLLCLGLYEGEVWLAVDPKLLDPMTLQVLQARARPAEDGGFRSEPDLLSYYFTPASLRELLRQIEPAYLAFVDRAANSATKMPWSRSHSPGVIEYLEEELRIDLPEPEYGASGQLSRLEEFEDLFRRFCDTFLQTPDGAKHLAWYPAARATGPANLAEIRKAVATGGQATDLILLKLLPHGNTEGNRARGAWIHVAPAVTKDLKVWFENAGWMKAEQWPAVATAVFQFVERSVAHPEELGATVQTFVEHDFKGFQMGMLSPILNALSPSHFVLLNNKSREALNYFAETDFKPRLEEYPAANQAALELLRTVAPVLEGAEGSALPSDLFDAFSHWLVGIEKHPLREPRYWKISPGKDGSEWEQCKAGGYIAINWSFPDVSAMSRETFDAEVDRLAAVNPEEAKGISQLWKFAAIEPGDVVLANRGTWQVLGVGRVTGPYYRVEGPFGHRLQVEWQERPPIPVEQPGWRKTLFELDEETVRKLVGELEASVPSEVAPPGGGPTSEVPPASVVATVPPPAAPLRSYPFEQLVADSGIPSDRLGRWIRLIRARKQVVLLGPPGTGKTWLAQKVADHLVSGTVGLVETIQFHPAYAYEDFIQGIRPVIDGGALTYKLQEGRFVEFCRRAEALGPGVPSVLILDEINRANLARVLGELMLLLEYRDKAIQLAAGGSPFRVPAQVLIIGTMNTADRSIARMDHALRRRFAFIRVVPDYEVLHVKLAEQSFDAAALVGVLQQLNKHIDDANFHLGISYFMRADLRAHLQDVWECEIEPYLEEFFFDQPSRIDSFRWDELTKTFFKGYV